MECFRLFQFGVFTSTLVYNMLSVATGWYVYQQTRDPFDLGLVGLANFLPALVMNFLSGHWADRHDRRRLIVAGNLLSACSAALLFFLVHQPFSRLAFLLAVGLVATARALEAPATAAYLPELVPLNLFSRAAAWNSSVKQIAKLVGPALGGLVYAVVGQPDQVFLLGAGGSLLTSLAFLMMKVRPTPLQAGGETYGQKLKQGVSYVAGNRLILGAISLDMCAGILGGSVALLPVFAESMGVGPLGLGFLRSAPAVGALLMALLLARQPIAEKVGKKMIASVAVFGLLTVVFGLSKNYWLSIFTLFLLGGADNISQVLRQSLIQLATPPSLRGRVSGINGVFVLTGNQLGEFESGAAAGLMGTVPAVVVGGLATCLVAWGWTRLFPSLVQFRNFDEMVSPSLHQPFPSSPQLRYP